MQTRSSFFPRFSHILSTLLAFSICLFSFSGYAASPPVSKIIAFGDSLSDNGNLYKLTNKLLPLSPPYFKGHFSNGPVWIEYLAGAMRLDPQNKSQFSNYAYAGTWASENIPDDAMGLVDLSWEVKEYIENESTHGFQTDNQLITIWVGGNDYLDGRFHTTPDNATDETVKAIEKNIDTLIQDGARHLLILNLPDLGLTPSATVEDASFAKRLSLLANMHNQKLAAMIEKEKTRHPNIDLKLFDVTEYFHDMLTNPEKYELSNTADACYTGDYGSLDGDNDPIAAKKLICKAPAKYVYWDTIHPTTFIHQLLASFIFDALSRA